MKEFIQKFCGTVALTFFLLVSCKHEILCSSFYEFSETKMFIKQMQHPFFHSLKLQNTGHITGMPYCRNGIALTCLPVDSNLMLSEISLQHWCDGDLLWDYIHCLFECSTYCWIALHCCELSWEWVFRSHNFLLSV